MSTKAKGKASSPPLSPALAGRAAGPGCDPRGNGAAQEDMRGACAQDIDSPIWLQYLMSDSCHPDESAPAPATAPDEAEIDVIADTSDAAGMAADLSIDADVTDPVGVRGMVEAVVAEAGGRPIRRLNISGHGRPGEQVVGKPDLDHHTSNPSVLNLNTVCDPEASETWCSGSAMDELAILTPFFTKDAVVTLSGCDTGEGSPGQELLTRLAELWGIAVRAGTSNQPAMSMDVWGTTVTCAPDETGKVSCTTDESMLDPLLETSDLVHGNEDEYWKRQGLQ